MKKIVKSLFFSAAAIYLTALWDKGFLLSDDIGGFIKAGVAVAIIYYLLLPISKIILLPLNLLTMGLMSFIFYLFALHILSSAFALVTIKSWLFPGLTLFKISLPQTAVSYFGNLVLTSISISSIINLLELIL